VDHIHPPSLVDKTCAHDPQQNIAIQRAFCLMLQVQSHTNIPGWQWYSENVLCVWRIAPRRQRSRYLLLGDNYIKNEVPKTSCFVGPSRMQNNKLYPILLACADHSNATYIHLICSLSTSLIASLRFGPLYSSSCHPLLFTDSSVLLTTPLVRRSHRTSLTKDF
jgi:hypothetical protein